MSALDLFLELLARNRSGEAAGQYSVCSAHSEVIRASMMQAIEDDGIALVEATSNQVDQHGGYTGMTPERFVDYVRRIAGEVGLGTDRILLGGDHLGPNRWRSLPETQAMENAVTMVEAYVRAGFEKIHLDASMHLADDDPSVPLDDTTVAVRAARLCRAAEDAAEERGTKPVYVIGTEVPIPGGAQEAEDGVAPTAPESARKTIETTQAAFERAGLRDAWQRVCGVVVQPGVEFGDDQVFDYVPDRAQGLSAAIESSPGLVYEAHSTDYQSGEALAALVHDHFCILKVGPWLTYAYREAMFALSYIEDQVVRGPLDRSGFTEVLESAMLANPDNWKNHYHGTAEELAYKRKYSYSDRCRYYLGDPSVVAAERKLHDNLGGEPVPLSLVSQFFPEQYWAIRRGEYTATSINLVQQHIRNVLRLYSAACGLR